MEHKDFGVESYLSSFGNRYYERYIDVKTTEQRQAEWNDIMARRFVREQGENLVLALTEYIKKLECELQHGESLVVLCDAGHDRITVREFQFPTWHLAIVTGADQDGNKASRIENVQDVKLTTKIMKSKEKAPTIGFVLPEPKERNE